MKLAGMMLIRNEDWILERTLRRALEWCDEVIVGLDRSTDRSRAIAEALDAESGGRVGYGDLGVDGDTWGEMTCRQSILRAAIHRGATHLAVIDADEYLADCVSPAMIRAEFEALTSRALLCSWLYNLRGGMKYHLNGLWGNRVVTIGCAVSDHLIGYLGDQYHAREPKFTPGRSISRTWAPIQTLHFWAYDVDRCRAKHRLYRVVERIRYPNKPVPEIEALYRLWAIGKTPDEVSSWEFGPVPPTWFTGIPPASKPPYWQDAEADRLIAARGAEFFRGLSI
jgi:glycosyltransferase involved in cell wall biosynthesis